MNLTPYQHVISLNDLNKSNSPKLKKGRMTYRYTVAGLLSVEGVKQLHDHATRNGLNRVEVEFLNVNSKPVKLEITSLLTHRVLNLVNNHKCVTCKREIAYYRIEDNTDGNGYHLNAYASDHRMMTRDHIIPRSAGGIDDISNYQLMCSPCNKSKGSMTMDNFIKHKVKPNKIKEECESPFSLDVVNTAIVQDCVFSYNNYPGLLLSFTATGTTLSLKRSKIGKRSFTYQGKPLFYVPEGMSLTDYPAGHNELINFQYFSINSLFSSMADIYLFKNFKGLYVQIDENTFENLDGEIVTLKD